MPSNVLRPVIPAASTLKHITAVSLGARAPLWRRAADHQARCLHVFDVRLPLDLELAIALGQGLLDRERGMHAPQVLGEEILAVELVSFALDGALGAARAAVEGQTQMLRGDVALPFVLGAESARAACEGEGAGERARVGGGDVLP